MKKCKHCYSTDILSQVIGDRLIGFECGQCNAKYTIKGENA